ncbi:hypothetical protein [Phenylobacterium sp.]|uniref:hypothetical protein n=1 Tax=Phenylobacterium sp. TaxID=1871053 RepID=UPI00272F31D9|nr:hypothetical protein [Phenylobacterium sp.]MDP2213227.1 hypothetical protein [Phenylobacterium sp.]
MQKSELTSTNPEYLGKLINFAGELFELFREIETTTLVYGSLAYVYHTDDSSIAVNDIDMLVPESILPKLIDLIDKGPAFEYELTSYHSLKVFKDDMKISFDGIEHYLDGLSLDYLAVEINGTLLFVVTKDTLKEVYKRGVESIPMKSDAYARKLATLEV